MTDGVVLLHGIGRSRLSMRRMEKRLQKQGYATLNFTYPSTRKAIEDIAEIIHPAVEDFAVMLDGKIHFIGYSMGGLVTRAYLHRYRPKNLGRVVMLGTPNNGSEIADFVQNWRLYKRIYGPASQQLLTRQDEFKHIFGHIDYELGSIAGVTKLEPLGAWIIRQPSDGTVSVASTMLDGMADHVVVKGMHTFLARNRKVWLQVLHFLQQGRFIEKGSLPNAQVRLDAGAASGQG